MEGCRPGVLTRDPVGESRDGELLKHQCRAPAHTPRALIPQVGVGWCELSFLVSARDCCPRSLFLNLFKNLSLISRKLNVFLHKLHNLPDNFIPHPFLRIPALDFPFSWDSQWHPRWCATPQHSRLVGQQVCGGRPWPWP